MISDKTDYISLDEWLKLLEQNSVSRTIMNQFVMDYLVKGGFKDTAVTFQQESGTALTPNSPSLQDRERIIKAIDSSHIEEAITLIKQSHSELLDNDRYLYFHLQQLLLIELIKSNKVEEALAFAQNNLSEAGEENPEVLGEIERTIALLAFDDPSNSPFADLLSPSYRQQIAKDVNTAILTLERQEPSSKCSTVLNMIPWSQGNLSKNNVKYPQMTDIARATLSESK